MKFPDAERFHRSHEPTVRAPGGTPMVAPAVEGIDLFKIAGRSISGWIPSLKAGTDSPLRQPFCSQLEERLLLYLEYHPQVAYYARGDIGPSFAATYRLPTRPNTYIDVMKGKIVISQL